MTHRSGELYCTTNQHGQAQIAHGLGAVPVAVYADVTDRMRDLSAGQPPGSVLGAPLLVKVTYADDTHLTVTVWFDNHPVSARASSVNVELQWAAVAIEPEAGQ